MEDNQVLATYIYRKVLAKFHLNKANPVNTPMKESTHLTQYIEEEGEVFTIEKEGYKAMTESVIFSIIEIKPNNAFAISLIHHFAKNPSHQHIEIVKIILKYLKSSNNRGITYGEKGKLIIVSYLNFNWPEIRKV